MQIPKSKSLLVLRNSISPYFSSSSSCSFHSTPTSLAKWKNKWKPDPGRIQQPTKDPGRSQQPSKSYIKYSTQQKRADAKKALKDLLFNSGCSKLPFQDEGRIWVADETSSWDPEEADSPHGSNKKARSKKSRRPSRGGKGKGRRNFSDDFDDPSGTVFQATFGKKCYTWSFRSWDDPDFQSSSADFEWRDQSKRTRNRGRVWDSTSETDEDDGKLSIVGSYSDRTILGLPTTAPLKIEDVKSAFRSSALKWHPDKHQGPSQVEAEEKFKRCVDAYNGLCNALSSR